ncbi:MAG: hypothetical protein JSS51_15375 [Planctomycetes bacterium]|nr:hypothetical protein [Planctomycetota bacterium]
MRCVQAFVVFGLTVAGLALSAGVGGCQNQQKEEIPTRQAALTPGGVRLNLVKDQTTQAQVQEAFGPPDLVTYKDGQQIWTYDKTDFDYEKRSDYWTLILVGQGGDRVRSSSRSTLLIVYFNDKDVVTDYRLSALKY